MEISIQKAQDITAQLEQLIESGAKFMCGEIEVGLFDPGAEEKVENARKEIIEALDGRAKLCDLVSRLKVEIRSKELETGLLAMSLELDSAQKWMSDAKKLLSHKSDTTEQNIPVFDDINKARNMTIKFTALKEDQRALLSKKVEKGESIIEQLTDKIEKLTHENVIMISEADQEYMSGLAVM